MSNVYEPPAFNAPIDLDLSRNEGRPTVTEVALDPDEVGAATSRYPNPSRFTELVAARLGVSVDRVLVTAGGDDALFRCFLATRGEPLIATNPSFEMIRRYAGQLGSPLREVDWWEGDFPIDDFLEAVTTEVGMAVIVSPNNPTGSVVTAADLRKVSAACPLVILDAAYAEFADEDLTNTALEMGNVVVIRTLSKAFGLAGLRVGYALGDVDVIERLTGFGSPYNTSTLSLSLAAEVMERGPGTADSFARRVAFERSALVELLDELGTSPMPSQANFVLATDVDPSWVVPAAASLGVGLRRFADRPDLSRCVRIGLPGEETDFARLTETLRSVLAPEALLFDIDGVIADRSSLEAWSDRLPLGIVTARPRSYANEFLERFGIADRFTTVVTRDDAPVKPDPAPLRMALERLGVSRAWMLGDTVDDLRAARDAGVVPIAVASSGDDRSALSGAARVLDSVNELEELLNVT